MSLYTHKFMPEKTKLSLKDAKKLPPQTLLRIINKAKQQLKTDETTINIFKKYNESVDIIDFIPTAFGNLNVSATTNNGVVTLNFKLLMSGDLEEVKKYMVHEYTHWGDQCLGDKPTKSSDDGDYLENKYEQKAFQNQVEYIGNNEGKEEAVEYVDDLLDYHDVDSKEDREEKEEILLSKV